MAQHAQGVDPQKLVKVDAASALAGIELHARAQEAPPKAVTGTKRKRDDSRSTRELLKDLMLDFSEKRTDVRLPYYIEIEAGTKIALNAVVAVSEPTANFILDLFYGCRAGSVNPDRAALADVIGDDGKQYLACDAGRLLFQILDMEPPAEVSLAALVQLPAVATYFKADSILVWLHEYYATSFQQLSHKEVLWVLTQLADSRSPAVHAVATGCLRAMAPCFTWAEDRRTAHQKDLKAFVASMAQGQHQARWFFDAAWEFSLQRWAGPVPEAMLCLTLLLVATQCCKASQQQARSSSNSSSSSSRRACCEASHRSGELKRFEAIARRCFLSMRSAPRSQSALTLAASRLVFDLCDGDEPACPLHKAVVSGMPALQEQGLHAPMLERMFAKNASAAAAQRSGPRLVLIGKPRWPYKAMSSSTNARGLQVFSALSDNVSWHLTMTGGRNLRRSEMYHCNAIAHDRVGVYNGSKSRVQARVRVAAVTKDDDLAWVTHSLQSWMRGEPTVGMVAERFVYAAAGEAGEGSGQFFECAPGEKATARLGACVGRLHKGSGSAAADCREYEAVTHFKTLKDAEIVLFVALVEEVAVLPVDDPLGELLSDSEDDLVTSSNGSEVLDLSDSDQEQL